MADARFFKPEGPFTVQQLADLTKAEFRGDADYRVTGVAAVDQAGAHDVTFVQDVKYLEAFKNSKAGVCIIPETLAQHAPHGMTVLVSPRPRRVYGMISGLFHPYEKQPTGEIHPSAFVDPSAEIGEGSTIEAFVVIGKNVKIGAESYICSHASIDQGVEIGRKVFIGSHVSISHASIGDGVFIKPGARIGQRGFGFDMDDQGHITISQLGRVIIEDGVNIGSNTCVDRGASSDTVIKKGSMIDNLCQISHNVVLGQGCVVVAQVGISGSTHFGNYVIAAGQAGFTGHLKIGDGAKIAAQSGVIRDIEPGQAVGGTPCVPVKDWHRQTVVLSSLIKSKKKGA